MEPCPCTIRLCAPPADACCPVCGGRDDGERGPRLFLADPGQDEPLCRDCGKRLAPAMVALLDLASTAERVGRCCRHLLTPPLESLLDLARAAENYTDAAPHVPARSG